MRFHLALSTSSIRSILLILCLALTLAGILYSNGVSAHSTARPHGSVENHTPIARDNSYTVHTPGYIGRFTTNDWEPDGDSLTYSVVTPPSHGSLSYDYGYPDAHPWYTPTIGYSGADSLTYQICDPFNACASATVTITIANQTPIARDDSYSLHTGGYIGRFTTNDWEPDGDSLIYHPVSGPSHGTISYDSGVNYPDPHPWYNPSVGFSGTDSLTYQICDSFNACSTATVTITVTNQAPIAREDSYTVHNPGYIGRFTTNDWEPDGDSLTYNLVTPPAHGQLYNDYGYPDPHPWYAPNPGFSGLDTMFYEICDSFHACSPAMVVINVVNQAPYARDSIYQITTDNGGYIGYFSIWDPDGDSLAGSIVSQPSHGTLYTNDYGPLRPWYLPNPGYKGPDSFVYQVCDSFGACARGNIYLNDDAPNAGVTSCNANVGKPVDNVGEPINVTNGNMYLQQNDYHLAGTGEVIDITRTYNSNSLQVNLFGKGWSSAYDESIRTYSNANPRLYLPDGRAVDFTGSGTLTPVQGDFHGQLVQNGNGTYTLTYKDGRVHQFNAAGKLTSLADRNNNQTLLTYDTGGNLTSITDASGRVLTVTRDTSGRVLSISDSVDVVATYTYSADKLLSVTYADTSGYQFSYNSSNLLTSVTDALGHILESHTYDLQGRALTSQKQGGVELFTLSYVSNTETDVTDALNHVTKYFFDKSKGHNVVTRIEGSCACGTSNVQTWTYDNQLNVLTKTDAANQTTTFAYDANGNLLTATNALGTVQLTYNGFGEVLTATDMMQGVLTNTYDTHGNLLTTRDPLNNTTTFTYNARGQLLTAKDARNNTTNFTLDTSGQLIEVKDAANHATTYAYDGRGRATSVTNALNETTNYEYDAVGRPSKVIYPDTSYMQFTYDLGGRRTKVRDPRGYETNFAYDAANRLTGVTNADNRTTSYSYNLMSRLTSQTDALNRTTNYEYDDFNRIVKTIYPAATTGATRLEERVEYNAAGKVKKQVDTMGRETLYDYDTSQRLIKVTDPALQITQYEYNARSQTTAVVDALNQRYEFAYDALGHVTQVTRGSVSMSYSYDAVGNRTQRTDYNNATTNYTYDNLNRLTTTTYPDTTTVSYAYDQLLRLASATNANGTVSFNYDNRGRVSSTTDVFNQTVGYGYDANSNRTQLTLGQTINATYQYDVLNRLTQLTDGGNAATTYSYDATNKLTTRTLPNGVTSAYQYDAIDRLTRLTDATSTTTVMDAQYQYNAASQITQIAEPTQTRNFSYDAADRLTAVQNPTQTVESYNYDAVGNRTASHLSSTYSYQPFNRVVTIGSNTYSYDANGHLTQKIDNTGTWNYSWDYENRLKQVTRPDSTTVSYKYDALGRRIQRSKSAGGSTNYIYDAGDVVKDINSDGSTVDYLNGPGVDDKLRQTSSTGTVYFTQDHLGSTRALTDASGNVVENINYDSFGNGSSTLSRYGYTGREWDAEANLYYYRNRWYDPQSARFISADPIGLGGGINLYAYVNNSSINRTDPFGLRQIQGNEDPEDQFSPDAVVHMKERKARESEGWWGMYFDDLLTHHYSDESSKCSSITECYEKHKFSSLFDNPYAHGVAKFFEDGAPISFAADLEATSLKATRVGVGGPKQSYASGFNWIGRNLARAAGRPDLIGKVNAIGNNVTPVLAGGAVFTMSYNATIWVQCFLGVLR
jgi:RHS repeat-associated protein